VASGRGIENHNKYALKILTMLIISIS